MGGAAGPRRTHSRTQSCRRPIASETQEAAAAGNSRAAASAPSSRREIRTAHGLENPEALTWKLPTRFAEASLPTRLPRKEVIQPHLPVRLPCYDLAPITGLTLGACLLTVGMATSGATDFRGLTGGVYKARERIHRCLLISDY